MPFIFAASGYRSFSAGTLGIVGAEGHGWSACPTLNSSDQSGFNLLLRSGTVYPHGNNYRAFGFPVRAVGEERGRKEAKYKNAAIVEIKQYNTSFLQG